MARPRLLIRIDVVSVESLDQDYLKLRNAHSPANFANSSTRQKFAIFGEFKYSPKWPFSEMCRTRQTRQHLPCHVARTCQTREREGMAGFMRIQQIWPVWQI